MGKEKSKVFKFVTFWITFRMHSPITIVIFLGSSVYMIIPGYIEFISFFYFYKV